MNGVIGQLRLWTADSTFVSGDAAREISFNYDRVVYGQDGALLMGELGYEWLREGFPSSFQLILNVGFMFRLKLV